MYPEDLQYTAEHEWVRSMGEGEGEGSVWRVGITAYAQEALGDIVFVTLPAVGTDLTPGQPVGEVESTKSVSDIYAPVVGTVTAVNDALDSAPELVNSDPYGEGWMFELRAGGAPQGLLDAQAYGALVSS